MAWEEYFNSLLGKYGLSSRYDDLHALACELLRWNKTHNLTAYNNWPDIAMGLMADSLLVAEYCMQDSCLDIGSGAGFPGLMLALACPDTEVTLLDARRKRVSFQQHAARMLDLPNVVPVWGRAGAEDSHLVGKKYNTVTCKALSDLSLALDLCQMYVKPGGRVVLPRGESDLMRATSLCQSMSGQCRIHKYSLPRLAGERFLLIIDVAKDGS